MFHIRCLGRSRNFLGHPARTPLRPFVQASPGRRRFNQGHDFLRDLTWLGEERSASHIRRRNAHKHEIRVSTSPAHRLLLRLEEPVDHDRVAFDSGPAGATRGFATAHRRTGIDREKCSIGKRNLASVRNAARIDGAMSRAQSRAGRTDVTACPVIGSAPAAGPIHGDSGQDGLLFTGMARRHDEQQ